MVELISFGIFLLSLGGVFFIISQKVPLLLAVPEQLIHESFVTKPSRLKNIELWAKSLLEWERYEVAGMLFLEKTLRRTRILLLKGDALVSDWLARLQNRSKNAPPREARYWQELRTWKEGNGISDIPESGRPTMAVRNKFDGIRKIFSK
ncbi:MAG: hypothetical protein Q7S66_05070 [bacterium]|nr:hypothetical protein [bacterium]